MLRKHINLLSNKDLKKIPFYSWECITLQLGHRDVYFVIKNQERMTQFIKLLIYSLKSIDGSRNSWDGVVDVLKRQGMPEKKVTHLVMNIAMRKFSVMRIRQKLSYMAFFKLNTVNEMIVKTILRCYR